MCKHECRKRHWIYLRVVHVPQQVALLRVQDEVAAQETAAALIFFNVQEAAEAILAVHVRHHNPERPGPALGSSQGRCMTGRELKGQGLVTN